MVTRAFSLPILFLIPAMLFAQLSPGRLARVHSTLEGIDKCTSCHPVGNRLSNDKCMECHKEIRTAIASRHGLHAQSANKRCDECHSDHNGEEFRIINFDTTGFDHRQITGFAREGKHATIACDSCHTWSYVKSPGIHALHASRQQTYLGLSDSCASCHADVHKGQFVSLCSACHDTKAWKPAATFSHHRSRYPLTGKHIKVACADCHKGVVERTTAVLYRGMPFSTCESCHRDPHVKTFERRCDECHTTADWKNTKGATFDHQRTGFPLNGKHATVQCLACHAAKPTAMNASDEQGFHISKFRLCTDCHADAHAGQFAHRADGGKCEPCHTDVDFATTLYSVEQHASSAYPLTGAHVATSCVACHKNGAVKAKSTRQYHWDRKVTCATCHTDPHKEQFSRANKPCESCHVTDSWSKLLFDHAKSRFPLDGKHGSVACAKCHEKADPVRYVGVDTACAPCHKDPHTGQFAKNGSTRCEPCHSATSWKNLTFDHNTSSRFILTKAHADVQCAKCHPVEAQGGKPFVRYKPLRSECEDCHKAGPHEQQR
jgi:hypothetical protein